MASAISRSQTSPHHSIVRVAGELDLVTAPLLRAVLKSADADTAHEFVVELSAVTFMDCSGLAPLLEAHARLAGRMQLSNPARAVSWLFYLAGLEATFAIDGSLLSAPGPGVAPPLGNLVARREDRRRSLPRATAANDVAPVHADVEHSGLGTLQVPTAAPGEAIGNRIMIEQATGLLMASLGCDATQASRALLQISWDHDAPIHAVAAELVAATEDATTPAKATQLAATATSRATRDGSMVGAHHRTDDPL